MHQVHSTPAFGSIGYAETNPFDVAHPPLLPAFPPAPYRDPFAVSSVLPTSTNDWTASAPKFYLDIPPGFERLPNIPSKLVDSHSMIQEQRPVVFLEVPPGFKRLETKATLKDSEACPQCIQASEQTVETNEKLRMSKIEVNHLKKQLSESQLALEQKEERIRILEEKLHEKEIQLNLKISEVQSLHTEKRQMEEKNERNKELIKQLKFEQMQPISSTTTEETEQDFYFLQGEKRIRLRGGDPCRSDDEERMEIEREHPTTLPTDVEFSQGFEENIWKYVEEQGIGPRDAMSLLFWNDFIEYECPRIAIKSPYLMQTHFNQVMLKNLWEREMRRDSKAKLLRSMGVSVTAQQHAFVRRNDKRWLVLSSNGFVKRWMSTEEDDEEDDYEERVARYNKEPHLFTPPPQRRNRNVDGSEGVEREGARDNRRHRSPISPLEGGSLLSPTVPPARKRSRADARLTIRNSSEGSPYCPANVKKSQSLQGIPVKIKRKWSKSSAFSSRKRMAASSTRESRTIRSTCIQTTILERFKRRCSDILNNCFDSEFKIVFYFCCFFKSHY
ncbi:hypothetical protein CAEBREN_23315 [Caenorhabditis brenneri]|uniref:Uncharacterized protein n=1 Tax=Caenorhabditis brenneri TaxID=135651 RepID=G0NEQ8_CAEBE|nr:hypothetical protein CAEBREN_23315 [Caenorhabditis brenneri]